MKSIIIIIVLVIIAICLNFYLKKKQFKILKTENDQYLDNLKDLKNKILKELSRCETICKNDETKQLLKGWYKEYEEVNKKLDEVFKLDDELVANETNKKQYKELSADFKKEAEYIEQYLIQLHTKLKNYTDFELENTNMALTLKEELRDVNNLFDNKIRIFEVYNNGFEELTKDIRVKVNDFEKKQKFGDFPAARKFLKEGNEILEVVKDSVEYLVKYYELAILMDKKLTDLNTKKDEMLSYNLENLTTSLNTNIIKFNEDKEFVNKQIEEVKLTDSNSIKKLFVDLENVNLNLDNYYVGVGIDHESILYINDIRKLNDEKISLIEDIILGTKEERKNVQVLYDIKEIPQFDDVEKEEEKFNLFKKDYLELNEMIEKEEKSIEPYKENIAQASAYLDRVIKKLKNNVLEIKNISNDELKISEKLVLYKQEVIKLNLYLREYKHIDCLNRSLEITYKEVQNKINDLEEELNKETIDISFLRITDNIINRLLTDLINNIQKDIKQRLGVEKLSTYYNRFVNNEDRLRYSKHFTSLYSDRNYRQILKEVHDLLKKMNPRGDILYKDVVNTIEVDPYESVFIK